MNRRILLKHWSIDMSFAKEVWETLASVDVTENINQKGKMSYLSWAWAWAQLMKYYPESSYLFVEPEIDAAGTVMVSCAVTIRDGDKRLNRTMWLPVMDYKNNSVVNPTSREVSDNMMRCLVKCIAMAGLGHYIYAGEDLPDPEVTQAAIDSKYEAVCNTLAESIDVIKSGIESGEMSAASEAWFELSEEEKMNLWKAPSKGGCFTTKEREVMKTTEFKEARAK
jgi:hypothetical protein